MDVFMQLEKRKWFEIESEPGIHIYPIIVHWDSCFDSARLMGEKFKGFLMIKQKDRMTYFTAPDAFAGPGKRYLQKVIKKPSLVEEIKNNAINGMIELTNFSKTIPDKNLSNKSNQELLELYETFNRKLNHALSWSIITPFLDWQKPLLSNKLKETLRKKLGKDSPKLPLLFSVLTTPTKETWTRKSDIELTQIALEGLREKKAVSFLKKPKPCLKNFSEKFPSIYSKLNSHHKNFCWLGFGYEGPPFSVEHFFGELIEKLEKNSFSAQKLASFFDEPEKLKQKQISIEKELGLSRKEKELFEIGRKVAFIKAYRKEWTVMAYFQEAGLLEEIAKRLYLSVSQVRNIFPSEMPDCLIGKKPNQAELNKRDSFSAILSKEKGKARAFTGEKAKKYFKETELSIEAHKISELDGECAFPGKVCGTVKLINVVGDLNKIEKGDILVSYATTPNLLPAMKKAAAIVTDMGGVTCHAAIVSRELNIPCVIGTRIATKVLKDGDKVSVNANHGIIKKLKTK